MQEDRELVSADVRLRAQGVCGFGAPAENYCVVPERSRTSTTCIGRICALTPICVEIRIRLHQRCEPVRSIACRYCGRRLRMMPHFFNAHAIGAWLPSGRIRRRTFSWRVASRVHQLRLAMLFRSQRTHRFYCCRSVGWQQTRDRTYRKQQTDGARTRQPIIRANLEEQTPHHSP